MGEFQSALVFYHRGHKIRPHTQMFRLGIQKAEEAIENSVGSKSFNRFLLLKNSLCVPFDPLTSM